MTVDLAALRAAVGGARVVALGEAAHNITELHDLRGQVFRTLVEHLGFSALVLESGFPEGIELDAWVQGAPGSVQNVAAAGITYGFGRSAAVHRQLTWLRGRDVRVYGMDLAGHATSPGPAVRALLARIPGRPGDDALLRRSELGVRAEAAVRYAALSGAEQERLLDDLLALAGRAAEVDDEVAERCAAALVGFVGEQRYDGSGPYPRDVFMADTVRWVLEREDRVLVSAHNGHVRRTTLDGRPMLGGLLAQVLGGDLVVIGTTFQAGPQVRITERSPRPYDWDVELVEGVPGPALPVSDASYDVVVELPEVHRVPGAFERLRDEVAPYPLTRTVNAFDSPAGVEVDDPYRWLEDESDEVHEWQRRQSDLATVNAFAGQDREALHRLIAQYGEGARPAVPRHASGRWFRQVGNNVVWSHEPLGEARPIVTLDTLVETEESAVLSWLAPSPDGRLLALGVCTDGSEHNRIRLVDVDTGNRLPAPPQVLHSAWAGGISWLSDSSGFFFLALTGAPKGFEQAVFRHRVDPPRTRVEPVPLPPGSREYTLVQVSCDGRWAVATHRVGSPVPVAVCDLAKPEAGWRPFLTRTSGTVAGHVVGDRYIAVTDVGAARGRVVAIPLHASDPDDVEAWEELVPEGPTVLRSLTPVGEYLYLAELDATFARVRVLDRSGAVIDEVPLPGRGAVAAPFFALTGLAVGPPVEEFLFTFSTLTSSWGLYRHRPGEPDVDVLSPPALTLDATVETGAAPASGGVEVPFHVVRSATADPTVPAPTLLTAYGAANVPLLPQYESELAAFVAAGGTLVQASLRGGGELGRDWYLAAHRETKHVRDDDLIAVAEHLVAAGVTSPDRLALTGGSDGGLMCGVAVTTRPDLWCAVLPRTPLFDLVAGMRDPYLDFVIRKAWGDPDDPADVRRMIGRSPYHLVRPADFPAVYVQAGANDPRCRPWHARKFVARLQAAQRGRAPVLLHVYEDAGHGAATAHDVAVAQDAEWLAFLVGRLGLSPSSR